MSECSKWYVIHTYSGYENKVATNIEKIVENRKMQDQILEVAVPTETVTEIKDDKKREVERKIYPGYVLVKLAVKEIKNELTMSDEAWYVIRNTRGVTGFVGPESKPIPLTDTEAIALGVEIRSVEVNYNVGDFVRIAYGTMEGSLGVVEEIDKNENVVTVKITMLSREVQVKLELDQVELVVD